MSCILEPLLRKMMNKLCNQIIILGLFIAKNAMRLLPKNKRKTDIMNAQMNVNAASSIKIVPKYKDIHLRDPQI